MKYPMITLQKRPDVKGSCMFAAYAMALGQNIDDLLNWFGNDWKSVAFPGLPEPQCFRGVHEQEFIRFAVDIGFAVTPIELTPNIAAPVGGYPNVMVGPEDASAAFDKTIITARGVLTGIVSRPGGVSSGHAMAFDMGYIFDPASTVFRYHIDEFEKRNFHPLVAWRVDKIENTWGSK